MRHRSRLTLALFCWLCLLAPQVLAQNYTPEQRQWLAQHRELRVGVTEMPPQVMRDFRNGTYSGLSIDMLEQLEQRLGVRLKMVYYGSLADMHEGIRQREIDLLFAAVPTAGREYYLSFPKPYARLENSIIVRQDTRGTQPLTLEQLSGRKVAVMAGSALEERLRARYPGIYLTPTRDDLTGLTKLAFGEVDAAITDLSRVTHYIQSTGMSNLAAAGPAGIDYDFSFGVRSDWPELTQLVDLATAAIPQDKKAAILERWQPLELPSPWNTPRFWLLTGGITALTLLALATVLFWNKALRRQVAARTAELGRQVKEQQAIARNLRESEARFRDLAELSYDWYWEQDENYRFSLVSGGAYEKGRLPLDLYMGKTRWELPLEGVSQDQLVAHRKTVEAHLPYRDFTYRFRTTDGTDHWYSASGRPVFDEDGQFRGYRGTGQDISERMRIQQALVDNEQRIRGLLDSTTSFVGLLDARGVLLEVNQAALDFIGRDKDGVLGRPFWETPWWTDNGSARESLKEAVERALNGEVVHFSVSLRARDGSTHWIDTTITPVRDASGRIIYLVPEGQDVTEVRRTQEALRGLVEQTAAVYGEAFLRSLVKHIATLFEVDYAFVGRLDAATMQVHSVATWAHGQPAPDFTYDLAHTPCETLFNSGPCVYASDICSLFPKDQMLADMGLESYMGAPIRNSSGEYIGLLVVMNSKPLHRFDDYLPILSLFGLRAGMEMERMEQDRTMRCLNEELERRVEERTAQLGAANRELEAFSYSVSHDLRAPLRHISGFVSLLQGDPETHFSESGQRHLSVIVDSANRMGELIDGLLTFSRIGRTEVHKAPVNLDKLLQEVIDDLSQEPHAPEVQWDIGALPQVEADRTLLRQVLANLVGNALKYSRKREVAKIGISAEASAWGGQAEWVFTIRDNGVGFNMKYANKLFGVFQRLHGPSEFEGTGIGLANVRRVVERHGGRVWAEGESNQGATFHFSLPREA